VKVFKVQVYLEGDVDTMLSSELRVHFKILPSEN